MKNKLVVLLKINFVNSLKLNKLKKQSLSKKILFLLLAFYIAFTVLFSIGFYLSEFLNILISSNMASLFIPLVLAISLFLLIFMTIYNAKSTLFECLDNDLLLSMPIKNSTIILSRIFNLFIYNFLLSTFILVPSSIIYITKVPVNSYFYIVMFFVILLIPVLPTIIACFFGYLLAFISSKTKMGKLLDYLYYIIFLGSYFYIFSNSSKLLNLLTNNVDVMIKILKYLFLPIYLISEAINANKVTSLIYFIILNLGILLLFVLSLRKSYFKILSDLKIRKTMAKYKIKAVKSTSVFMAVLKKELKRFISSPVYVMNTIMGPLMLMFAAFASFNYKGEELIKMFDLGENIVFANFVFMLITFVIVMTNSACISVSLEKNNLWILKSFPIKEKHIFKAKLFVNYLLIIPILIISLILFTINGFISIYQFSLLLTYGVLLAFITANYGLLVNLRFPKLDATNDAQIVKRSTSVMVATVIPLLLAIVLMLFINTSFIILIISGIIICLSLFIMLKYILNNWGQRKFKEL